MVDGANDLNDMYVWYLHIASRSKTGSIYGRKIAVSEEGYVCVYVCMEGFV